MWKHVWCSHSCKLWVSQGWNWKFVDFLTISSRQLVYSHSPATPRPFLTIPDRRRHRKRCSERPSPAGRTRRAGCWGAARILGPNTPSWPWGRLSTFFAESSVLPSQSAESQRNARHRWLYRGEERDGFGKWRWTWKLRLWPLPLIAFQLQQEAASCLSVKQSFSAPREEKNRDRGFFFFSLRPRLSVFVSFFMGGDLSFIKTHCLPQPPTHTQPPSWKSS